MVNGVWSNLRRRGLDGRSKLAKAMDAAEADLVAALGGNEQVTPQQRILLDRCVYKPAKCVLFEITDFSGNMEAGAAADNRYLAWANRSARSPL